MTLFATHNFLEDMALVLCVAALASVICQVLRQPMVVGYLVAGMVVGPYIPGVYANTERMRLFSDLGVTVLIFSGAQSGPVHEQRSAVLPPIVSVGSIDRGGDDAVRPETLVRWHRAGFRRLALEIPQPGRPAANRCRAADADPTHEHGEYALGCAADSGRTAQARLCGRAVGRCKYMVKRGG